jgi:hypothetical protein
MIRLLCLLVLGCGSLFGQLTLYVVDGTTETVLTANSVLQFPATESGDTRTVRLRVRNQGAKDEQLTQFVASGVGFTLNVPPTPLNVAPGGIVNATLIFTAGAPANYSANIRMNGTTVLALAPVTSGPVLTIAPGCLGTAANTIDFGSVARGAAQTCSATLTNPGSQAVTISTLGVTGEGFAVSPASAPFILAAGQSVALRVTFNATAAGQFSGTLQVQNRTYALAVVVYNTPLPQPLIDFGSSPVTSAQQRPITVKLASPAAVAASGTLNVEFLPDANTVQNDPAVMFLESGTRQVRFAVEAGASTVKLNGKDAVTLQTGSSAGRLRFTFGDYAPGFATDPTLTMTIAAAPVALDKTVVAKFPERLDVTLTGFDNTYSMGAMTFRFYDANGNQIGAAVPADFSAAFRSFFSSGSGGSTFRVTVTFPAKNNGSVAAVEADLTNTAGTTRVARLRF